MTHEQDLALKALERAFARCAKAGLQFCGMDDNLHYATEEAAENSPETGNDNYCSVARAVQNTDEWENTGTVKTSGAYLDSGGW